MNSINWNQVARQHVNPKQQPLPLKLVGKFISTISLFSRSLSSRIMYKLWFKPIKMKISENDKAWLDDAVNDAIQVNNRPVPVYKWGEGPSVLCVHGWAGHAGQFRQLAEVLVEQGYSVISFDAPAHGQALGDSTNIFEISQTIREIAKQYGNPQAYIAHSIGGLALCHAQSQGLASAPIAFVATPLSVNYVIDVTQFKMTLSETVANDLRRNVESNFGADTWDLLSLENYKVNQPTHFIYDRDDDQVAIEVADFIKSKYSKAGFTMTEKLGHNRVLRDKDTTEILSEFLSKHIN